MKTKRIILMSLAGLVLVGSACHRGGWGHGHRVDPQRVQKFVHSRVEDALDDLDATAAQRQLVAKLEQQLVAEGLLLRDQSQQARRELFAQFKSPAADKARLHAMVDERIEGYRKFAHQMTDAALDVQATLSPEQRAKIEKKLARFEHH